MNDYQEPLKELRQQEEDVQFTSFSNDMALQVGLALREEVRARGKAVTIDITRNGQRLFHFAMPGTASDNGEWIRRKNNVVNRFGHSSYYMGIHLKNAGQTMEEKYLISSHDYAAHGGAFPLIIRGVGAVGTITVSGLPQQEDHEVVITTLKKFVTDKAS
jgi:uncharacterized protein (UPF0303 family)